MLESGVRPPTGEPLVGSVVRLDLMVEADAPDLFAALDDPRVWEKGYGGGPAGRPVDEVAMQAWVERSLANARSTGRAAYTLRLVADSDLGAAGTVVGTSSLGDVDLANERVHLGWTAYGPRWWGTAVNPEAKLLLLGHAFTDCGFGRVKIQTDLLNERSQAAIARLGATREGVLRRHLRRADGTFRDTVVFSILKDEWPVVEERLTSRIRSLA